MLRILITCAAAVLASAPALADDGGRKFTVSLSGPAEVPGPGDADGRGTAMVRINPGQGEACYSVTYENIEEAKMAHIHRGSRTEAGPIVVNFLVSEGTISGCTPVSRELAMELVQSPEAFYVNVHNTPFPRGAIRGQMAK